jgi:HK97 family phage major capsid protein
MPHDRIPRGMPFSPFAPNGYFRVFHDTPGVSNSGGVTTLPADDPGPTAGTKGAPAAIDVKTYEPGASAPEFSNWQEKKDYVERLATTVKGLVHEGITDADLATKAHNMMSDVRKLGAEVKAERLAEENARLAEVIQQFEAEFKSVESGLGLPTGSQLVVPGRDDLDTEFKAWAGYGGQMIRTLYSEKMARRIGFPQKMMAAMRQKALAEGVGAVGGSGGGFLVPPAFLQNLFAEVRRQGNSLRAYGWMTEIPVETNVVFIPTGSGSATVGIVSENATKPSADQGMGQAQINIFLWAGISKVSRQLMDDSSPTVAELITRELGSLLGNLEEQKCINGSGTGEPRGILNTSGINNVNVAGAATAQGVIDALIDGIAAVQQTYFAPPNGVLMHPRRLAMLQKGKDTQQNYILNPPGSFRQPTTLGSGVTSVTTGNTFSLWSFLGTPIGVSMNIPTNLAVGGGANEDAVIIGDWSQAYWFQRQDITVDSSDEAGTSFEANQVWFRLEERAGFAVPRYPTAFCTLTGPGLV